jgi:hypothetical protein
MRLILFALLVLSQMSVLANWSIDQNPAKPTAGFGANFLAPEHARQVILPIYSRVIQALRSHDMNSLSRLVHPAKGVKFAPYAYLEPHNDLRFTADTIPEAFADQQTRLWNSYDGSGDPIQLSFTEYYQVFVYSRDFALAPNLFYDSEAAHRGNTIDNSRKEFPNAITVEAYDPGDESTKWSGLRLLFEQYGGTWYLMYIVHDGWTI